MGDIVLENDVVTLRDPAVASQMTRPRTPNTSNDVTPCESCNKPLDEVFITTGGMHGDDAVWTAHPIAVDGWACLDCGVFRYPRNISPDRITQIMEQGVEHGRAGRFSDAEHCFLRVVWNWPGYSPGHLNYAEATRSRLHHTRDALDDSGRGRLVDRMIEQYEEGVAEATQGSPGICRAYLTLVEHALHDSAHDRARRFLTQLSRLTAVDDETLQRAAEMLAFVEQRLDLFQRAVEIVMPALEGKPTDRKALAAALTDLEEHLRHAPDRWQSAWVYAKALFAADRADDGFAAFERFSQRFPDSTEIARDYSNHLLKAERNDRARDVNRAIVARYPDDAAMLSNLAVTELLCGDLEAARDAVTKARVSDPNDPIAKAVEARILRGAPFPATLGELERGG